MKIQTHIYRCIVYGIALICVVGCKVESKLSRYKDIYTEKPATVYIAPTIDQSERPDKKLTDRSYNNQLDVAYHYMPQSLRRPFVSKGYYVLPPLVSSEIAKIDSLGECNINDTLTLKRFADKYGVDAVLFTFIYKWEQRGNGWYVYVEYYLKSTRTYSTLLNAKIKAGKHIPLSFRGEPTLTARDAKFTENLNLDKPTSQRALLLDLVNNYVLRDLPWANNTKDFEKDINENARFECMEYFCDLTGVEEYRPMSVEEFDQDCFLLDNDER